MLLTKRWTAASASSEAKEGVKAPSAPKSTENEGKVTKEATKAPKVEATNAPKAEATKAPKAETTKTPKAEATKASAPAAAASLEAAKKEGKKARRKRHQRHIELNSKEPQVAGDYLRAWKRKEEDGEDVGEQGPWKFNKATQAWLLRHCYDSDKVPKENFRLLLRYIDGLKGAARERLRTEAGAIVLLKGAPLAPVVAEEDANENGSKKKRRNKNEEAKDGAAEGRDGAGGGEGAAGEEVEAETDAAKAAELSEAEAKARKLRMRRAEQVIAALGEDDEEEA